MNNRTKTELSPISTYTCAELGAIHYYIKHHLKPIISNNNFALSEPMVYGLGCGLAFNFEQNSKGAIHVSTINDQHIKDVLAHLNIKAWYKTEPNPHRFLDYLGDLLLQSAPVLTFNKRSTDLSYQYYPVLVLECNSEKTLFEVYDFYTNEQKSLNVEELLEACDFSEINASYHNFWFDIALAEKIFPVEKSIKWALVKNMQSMLYSPIKTKGITAFKAFSSFLQNMQYTNSNENILNYITYIKSVLKTTNRSSIANRGLFIHFLILAMEILKINELSSVADAFRDSQTHWEYLYNALEMITNSNESELIKLLENAYNHCNKIIEIEETALKELEKIMLR